MKFLLAKGSLYKVYNNNLLYHGCVPLNEDGTLKAVEIYGKRYRGRELYDALDNYVRKGFVAVDLSLIHISGAATEAQERTRAKRQPGKRRAGRDVRLFYETTGSL